MKLLFTSSIALVMLAACGFNSTDSDVMITGGKNASAESPKEILSSVVSLAKNTDFFNTETNHRSATCTGVILSNSIILTAAHCTEMLDREMTLVVFANNMKEALKSKGTRIRQVTSHERHPNYPMKGVALADYTFPRSPYAENPEGWMKENPGKPPNDLALIHFSGGLPAGYVPVKLADPKAANPAQVTLAGFGITSLRNFSDNGILRYVEQVKVHTIDADSVARHFLPVAETMDVEVITPTNLPRGACPGDSGGPAFVADKSGLSLIGILSLGESAKAGSLVYCLGNPPKSPSTVGNLYTDIRNYREWLAEAVSR